MEDDWVEVTTTVCGEFVAVLPSELVVGGAEMIEVFTSVEGGVVVI